MMVSGRKIRPLFFCLNEYVRQKPNNLLYNAIAMKVSQNIQQFQPPRGILGKRRINVSDFPETASSAIFIYQGNKFRYVNKAMEAITGYTQPELLTMDFWDFIHPDYVDLIKYFSQQRNRRDKDSPSHFEIKIINKEGKERWLDFTPNLIEIQFEGRPAGLGTAFDISQRKNAEQSSSQTEVKLRRRAEELSVLHSLSLDISAPLELPEMLQKIVKRSVELLNAAGGAISLCDDEHNKVVVQFENYHALENHHDVVFAYGEGAAGWVAQTGKPLIIDDYRIWDGRASVYEERQPYSAVLSVPMISQGKVIGVLQVMADNMQRLFDQSDQELLSLFANQAAIAVENARLLNQASIEKRHLSLLYDVGRELTTSLDPDEILNRAITLTCQALEGLVGQAFYYVPNNDLLSLRAIYGRPATLLKDFDEQIAINPGRGLAGWTALHRQPVYVPDVTQDERWLFVQGIDDDARSAISAPILAGERLFGVLSVLHVETGAFSSDQLNLLQGICQEVGLALSNATRYQQAQRQLAEITLIQNLAQTFNRRLGLQALLNVIVTQLAERLGYPLVEIFLIEGDSLVQRAAYGVAHSQDLIPLTKGIIGRVARTGQAALIPDVYLDPDYIPSFSDTVSELVVPIFHSTVVVGVVNIESRVPGQLTVQDRDLLEVLAVQVSIALENAVLYDHLVQHAADLEHKVVERTIELTELYELSQKIGYTLSTRDLLQMLLSHLRNALRSDLVMGGMFSNGQRLLIVETNQPLAPDCVTLLHAHWLDMLQSQNISHKEYEDFQPEIVHAKTFDTGHEPLTHIDSLISSPITVAGDVVGLLIAGCARENAFAEAHIRILNTFANQAAVAFQRMAAILAAEQKRLEGLVEHLPVGILLLDSEFRLVVANPLGKEILAELSEEYAEGSLEYLGSQSVAELVARHNDQFPVEIVQRGTARRVFEAQARPAGKETGQWLLVLREVTYEREYQMRIQMQERLATVGQLAAGIAHDFNNIMAAIMVYTDLLSDDPNIPPTSQDRLNTIQQQVQRATSLIRQILDFSRRSVMEQCDLDLLPFTKELDKMLRRVLPETIQLELSYRSNKYMVRADPTRLQQALMNLALNARDAMPDGGLLQFELNRILIQPGERPPMEDMLPGEWIRFTISDTGQGISTDKLPHIFEPFFTTKPVGQGTGLGLAQVYGIIKQHDGFIDVKSRKGAGTTFSIYLPASSVPPVEEPVTKTKIQFSGGGRYVLVVEDDQATREALEALLEAHQYSVVTSNNGAEALKLLEDGHTKIDLIVSDVVMPQMGGVALYREVRNRWPQIKFLFITGHPMGGEYQDLLEKGKVLWLQKPFSAQSFNQSVHSLLEE